MVAYVLLTSSCLGLMSTWYLATVSVASWFVDSVDCSQLWFFQTSFRLPMIVAYGKGWAILSFFFSLDV